MGRHGGRPSLTKNDGGRTMLNAARRRPKRSSSMQRHINGGTIMEPFPNAFLAIPILEIELLPGSKLKRGNLILNRAKIGIISYSQPYYEKGKIWGRELQHADISQRRRLCRQDHDRSETGRSS